MALTKTYCPTLLGAKADWILGRWRPATLELTERQAAYELQRGVIELVPPQPSPSSSTSPSGTGAQGG